MDQPTFWSFFRQAPPRTRRIVMGVGAVAGLVFVIGLGTVGYLLGHLQSEGAEPAREQASVAAVAPELAPFEAVFQIRRMNIPLTNRAGNQVAYAQFDLVFDCPRTKCKEEMGMFRAQIRDAVYTAAAGLRVEHFRGEAAKTGFKGFKKNILTQVQRFVQEEPPRDLVISNWVMQ